jgi:ABC-type bacteriocin/lantibiotic exporter with double-glycine peptidase domain
VAQRTLAAFVLLLVLHAAAFAAENLWLDVPFVKQQKNGCGPASIAMVMQYWQKQPGASPKSLAEVTEIVRALQPNDKQGIRTTQMERYFQQNGYRVFAFAGQWSDLERELAKGRPLIAALRPDFGNLLHYVVVAGVDDQQRVVLLNDPAQRKLLKEDRSQFEEEWKVTGFWTLLAVPAAPMPAAQ